MQYQDKYLGFVIDYSPVYEDYRVMLNAQIVAQFKSYDECIEYVQWAVMSKLPQLSTAVG